MAQGCQEDAARLLVLLVAVHIVRVALIAAVQRVGQHAAQRNVQQPAAHDGKRHLAGQQQHQHNPLGRLGRQQRDRLIAGGDKDRQHRAGGDDPAGVQVGGHRAEAALRHTAQQRAGDKAPAAAAGQRIFDALAVVTFQPFNQQISQIQEGQHFNAVNQGVQKGVYKQFHEYLSIVKNLCKAAQQSDCRAHSLIGDAGAEPRHGAG